MTDLSHLKLADRELYLRQTGFFKDAPQPQYAIVFEDPDNLDGSCAIIVPAPNWLAMAMRGGCLPPIETYLRDKNVPDGAPKEHPYAEPIGPMTEEEAMEYLLQKDVPMHVWSERSSNSRRFVICKRSMVPADRDFRNAWALNQEIEYVAA